MTSLPHALLFDLDGTLADSVTLILSAFRHAFTTHFGAAPPDAEWIAGMGTPLETQMRALVDDDATAATLVASYREWQHAHHDELLREYAGVRDTLALLRGRGHAMAVVTSKGNQAAQRALDRLQLAEFIDVLIGQDSTTRHKPDPEPVLLALQELGRDADDALFVGDSPHDILAGNAAGVFTVGALWGPFPRGELERAAPRRLIAEMRALVPLLAELDPAALPR